ncbi:PI-PLC X domain-containing protein At5g67130 [Dendrobium catenatum]|uniref:PI-PLC X domain-containing protein At5g67130 n=1 Tax=Dendrobium catenatum TaxID=906689 RepID=UPI0010A02096|nr:PI-PLC X domain-containing protein At5g67130 [Dendrobium catenatum]
MTAELMPAAVCGVTFIIPIRCLGVFPIVRLVPFASCLDGSFGSRFVRSMITDQFKLALLDPCSSDSDCGVGTYCFSCLDGSFGSRCVRSMITDQFKLVNNSMPFNKYAYLTTHNSYAIVGEPSHTGVPRSTFTNQEDTVTQQLNNGVRALMLDTYDFQDDVWLCHSPEGKCNDFTAFEPAIDTLKEIEAFLSANPSEIITLILEDYVHTPNGLNNVFNRSGLLKFWFPLSKMPQNGQDWPLISDMVANNQRLLVFTSIRSKQDNEGIAYQWNFMVENQYGDDGMKAGNCSNRAESNPLTDTSKSLVLVNYFPTIPIEATTCRHNSEELINMLDTCYGAASNRWANFVAVDFYKRSKGGGAFQATDMLNGRLLCGCDDVHACAVRSSRNFNQFMPYIFQVNIETSL